MQRQEDGFAEKTRGAGWFGLGTWHLAVQVAGSPAYGVAVDREQGNRERREERDGNKGKIENRGKFQGSDEELIFSHIFILKLEKR